MKELLVGAIAGLLFILFYITSGSGGLFLFLVIGLIILFIRGLSNTYNNIKRSNELFDMQYDHLKDLKEKNK